MSDDPEDGGDDGSTNDEDREDPFEVIDDPETDDPFELIDVDDRDADPFEQIGDPPDDDAETVLSSETVDGRSSGTPAEASGGLDDADRPASTGEDDDPFAGFDREERLGDPFAGLSDGEVESGRPDADLWEELSRSDVEPETERAGQRRFAEVSKHSYCERCEYFSKPPDVACSHDGTDIIEFVDSETVRVADCPIVAEREQLADLDVE